MLSGEAYKSSSFKLIGQFRCDGTGCKIQIAYVSHDWSVFDLSVMLCRYVWFSLWFCLYCAGSF